MKVLHVMDYLGIHGGLFIFLSNIKKYLENIGFEFFYLAKQNPPYEIGLKHYFNVCVAEAGKWKDYVEEINPDIIHFHDVLEYVDMQWCIERFTCIRTVHDNYLFCPYGFFKHNKVCRKNDLKECKKNLCLDEDQFLLRQKYINIHKKMALITCLSNSVMKKCITYGFDERKIMKIPALLPEEKILSENESVKYRIIYAGRVVQSKGVAILIESLILLKDLDWELFIIGTGEREFVTKLVRKCVTEGIDKRVHFLGHLEHEKYISMLQTAYLCVFPSIAPEGFGYVPAEALRSGVPIISFESDGNEEWLENNRNGFIVQWGNKERLSMCLSDLLTDQKLWEKIKKGAILKALQLDNIENQVETIEQMYLDIYNEKIYRSRC